MKIGNFFHKKTQAVTEKCSQEGEPCVSEDVVPKASGISQCTRDTEEFNEDQWVKEERCFNDKDRENSKSKGRSFFSAWLSQFDWLSYHREKRAVFCELCTAFKQKEKSPFVYNSEVVGFNNWKKALEKFREHAVSKTHREAEEESRRQGIPEITVQLDKQISEQQEQRFKGLISHLCTLKTLLRQGIAIRGKDETNSNIFQLNLDKARTDDNFRVFLRSKSYFGHALLAEQEQMLVLNARIKVLDEIRENGHFGVIADEATDISKKEQMSITTRTCTKDYTVKEYFIGIRECNEGIAAESLLKLIKDTLIRCGLPPKMLSGCSFDGASAMVKLGRLLKEWTDGQSVYIHCLAHCNELIIKDVIAKCSLLAHATLLCEDLYVLAGVSPKRILLFEDLQSHQEDNSNTKAQRLQSLSVTRWTTRGKAAKIIIEKRLALLQVLEELNNDKAVTEVAKAKSRKLKKDLSCFVQVFGLTVFYELLSIFEDLSKNLQRGDLTAELALFCIKKVELRVKGLREDAEFERHFKKVETLGLAFIPEESLEGRSRKIPKRLDNTDIVIEATERLGGASSDEKGMSELRRSYVEVVDSILMSAEERFNQQDLGILKQIENLILGSINGERIKNRTCIISAIATRFASLDLSDLGRNLDEAHLLLRMYNNRVSISIKIKEVTRVRTVAEIINAQPASRKCMPALSNLIRLYMSIPLSSATAERTFSAMRRLKSWIRSTSSANHLNNIMFANMHKEEMDGIDIEGLAREFARKNEARQLFFGKR